MRKVDRLTKSKLERDYLAFFHSDVQSFSFNESSLEQPSILTIVPSISTSGAYQEPIKLNMEIEKHAKLG